MTASSTAARYDAYIARVKAPFLALPDTDENEAAMLAAIAAARRVWANEAAAREWEGDIDEVVRRVERAVASLGDDLLELGRQHARDVDALRESIRATDRVLADRTSHLA